jgi:hypothetical protein
VATITKKQGPRRKVVPAEPAVAEPAVAEAILAEPAADSAMATASTSAAAKAPQEPPGALLSALATFVPERHKIYPDQPARRPLRIYSFDPMLANTPERVAPAVVTVDIPWEPLDPGPRGARVIVTDYDSSRRIDGRSAPGYYEPVALDTTRIALQAGLPPSESDPRFAQQMVYAVAMRTLEAFDKALGRRVRPLGGRLRLYPHAFRGENAFYDPDLKAVLFGYFQADKVDPGKNLPRQFVYTSLSGDIASHEVTHALVHKIRPGLLERTNRDVAAFHEAIADITAIFLHFTLPHVVEDTIAATRGDLNDPTPLNDLAGQFGYATGRGQALRSALDTPDPTRYEREAEPHARGAILVAAVFDAFKIVYNRRIADLLRLATGGSGILGPGALHPDLVARVAKEAIRAADQVLTACLRAFDFLPPRDVTFSDFLRAMVTSDRALYPTDGGGLRTAFIDAFRRRGIYPQGVPSLGESSLAWQPVDRDHAFALPTELRSVILSIDALQLNPWQTPATTAARDQEAPLEVKIWKALEVFLSVPARARAIGMSPRGQIRVRAAGATFRYDEDGAPRVNFTVQCEQIPDAAHAPGIAAKVLAEAIRRSATIIFDESGWVQFVVTKPLPADDLGDEAKAIASQRYEELVEWLDELAARDPGAPFGLAASKPYRVNFALLHAGIR